ncbi:MAG: hypothetical protein ACI9TV_002922 [Sulfurimonas sp.]|jgi:hypothetical protein
MLLEFSPHSRLDEVLNSYAKTIKIPLANKTLAISIIINPFLVFIILYVKFKERINSMTDCHKIKSFV